jgi:hypothetical protein
MVDDGVSLSLTASVIATRAYRSKSAGSLVLCVWSIATASVLRSTASEARRCPWLLTNSSKIFRCGLVSDVVGVIAGRTAIGAIWTMFEAADFRPRCMRGTSIKWTFSLRVLRGGSVHWGASNFFDVPPGLSVFSCRIRPFPHPQTSVHALTLKNEG